MWKKMTQPFWLTLGVLSLILGILGIPLPLLPTTPFILLAAFCFAKSSPKLHRWLMNHNTFGPLIENWQKHGKISRKVKTVSLTTIALMPLLSWAFKAPMWAIWVQCGVLVLVASFIATRPE